MLQTRRPALSGNALKGIAILAMTLDHLTWTLWPGYSTDWWVLVCHLLGRVTAPIMWFFVVEGYHYTHDVKKYAVRLFALAFISHFAYDFCFGIPFLPLSTGPFNQTGVVWSLAWGLMLLVIHDDARLKGWVKIVLTFVICAITFPSDWSCVAAMAILFMGRHAGTSAARCAGSWCGQPCMRSCTFSSLIRCTRSCSSAQRSPSRCCAAMTAHAANGALWAGSFTSIIPRTSRSSACCACCSGARAQARPPAASEQTVQGIGPDGGKLRPGIFVHARAFSRAV